MTDWERLARPSLRGLARYDPGPTRDELRARHGLADLEPLNWNEDLFGPPQEALDAAADELRRASLYPERAFAEFRDAVAGWLDVPAASIVPAHGAQALIASAAAAFIDRGTPVVAPRLTYGLYAQVSAARGGEVTRVEADGVEIDLERMAAEARARDARVVWICDPNNPTGLRLEAAEWRAFLDAVGPDCVVIADEAYMDYVAPLERVRREEDIADGRRVVVLRTFSKIFGLAGLRLGYLLADADLVRYLNSVQEPFNVNRAALAAGTASLGRSAEVAERRDLAIVARERLARRLAVGGMAPVPSSANFVLVDLGGVDDGDVNAALVRRGVLVRPGSELGLPGWARITVGPEEVMDRAAAALLETRLDLLAAGTRAATS